jgi:outer membrane lipoprotein-sorting protein
MRSKLFILFFLLLGCIAGNAQRSLSDASEIARIKKGAADAAGRTSTIISGFTQEKEMNILEEKIRSSGKFYFKKEKLLRWEYIQPYSYIIVINNDRITVRDEKKTSQFDARSNKVFTEVNRIIVGSIRGTLLNDEQNFSASFADGSTAWIVKLVPLSAGLKSTLSQIILWFDKKDFSVTRLEMIENTGDKTIITFTDKRFNEPIADEKFILK